MRRATARGGYGSREVRPGQLCTGRRQWPSLQPSSPPAASSATSFRKWSLSPNLLPLPRIKQYDKLPEKLLSRPFPPLRRSKHYDKLLAKADEIHRSHPCEFPPAAHTAAHMTQVPSAQRLWRLRAMRRDTPGVCSGCYKPRVATLWVLAPAVASHALQHPT
eukprot:366024-Chlamydomonas_euryale.AAC.11